MTIDERVQNLVAARRMCSALAADHKLASGNLRKSLGEASDAAAQLATSLEDSLLDNPIGSPREAVFGAFLLKEQLMQDAKSEGSSHEARLARLADSLLRHLEQIHGIDVASLGLHDVIEPARH